MGRARPTAARARPVTPEPAHPLGAAPAVSTEQTEQAEGRSTAPLRATAASETGSRATGAAAPSTRPHGPEAEGAAVSDPYSCFSSAAMATKSVYEYVTKTH